MAKQSEDREDLLRDGRAMPIRGRAWIDGNEVVVGFRSGGQGSLYWGQDPVFQFNADGELRRLFLAGRRYSAEAGVLMGLAQRAPGGRCVQQLQLQRHAICEDGRDDLRQRWKQCRQQLLDRLSDSSKWEVIGSTGEDFVARCRTWVQIVGEELTIAKNAAVA